MAADDDCAAAPWVTVVARRIVYEPDSINAASVAVDVSNASSSAHNDASTLHMSKETYIAHAQAYDSRSDTYSVLLTKPRRHSARLVSPFTSWAGTASHRSTLP